MKKGQYQEALGKYTECLKLKPKECAVYTNRLEASATPTQTLLSLFKADTLFLLLLMLHSLITA